jgi:hypothetical protein
MEKRIEKIMLEDGRRAEKHIVDEGDTKVQELHVEDERPLRLAQRVVEKRKPIVYERNIQTIKDGQVVEEKLESLDPSPQMQLREHLGVASQFNLQDQECDCHVTKEEMIDAIVTAIKASKEEEKPKKANFYQSVIAERSEKEKFGLMDKVLLLVIAAQLIGLGYIIFWM